MKLHGYTPRTRTGEVLPVPVEMIPRVWKKAVCFFAEIPQYDVHRLFSRLLTGQDRLWVATGAEWSLYYHYLATIVTTITAKPPSTRLVFKCTDPAGRRSLTVHLAGIDAGVWIDSAVERITAYGKEQRCRQLFLLAKMPWREYAMRFYSRDWDRVGYSRDRPTKAKGVFKLRNRVGYYRLVLPVPAEKWKSQLYNMGRICYFKEETKEGTEGYDADHTATAS
jgi:hypothetical protein